jgi:acyl-CoA thioester hydrolase
MNEQLIQWQWPNPHISEITVTKKHTDRLGHTNNVRYLEWLEGIAWSHIEALGCGWGVKEALGKAMVIVRTEIDYISASYEGDKLLLGTWITSSDMRLQSTRHFQMVNTLNGKTILKAKMDFACISLKTGRPSKMPKEFVEAHEKGLGASFRRDVG